MKSNHDVKRTKIIRGTLTMGSLIHLCNPECFAGNMVNTSTWKAQQKIDASTSCGTFFQALQSQINATDESGNEQAASFENLCKAAFERNFGHSATTTYYHVMDATSIPKENWCHEDFPYDKFFTNEVDTSILDWRSSRANPSQLSSEIQSKVTSTLGKCAIVVPPALDEKMKTDPALREKVAKNIDKIFAFHVGGAPMPALPGTKRYGTKLYSAVVVLDENGEVDNCRVSSGGSIIGPNEETLRQIEREQKRKAKRKAEALQLAEEAAVKRFDARPD